MTGEKEKYREGLRFVCCPICHNPTLGTDYWSPYKMVVNETDSVEDALKNMMEHIRGHSVEDVLGFFEHILCAYMTKEMEDTRQGGPI